MTVAPIFFFFVFAAFAGSYGWGMRGTIIGGEKGAMLPGALLGLVFSLFSGSEFLSSHPLLLAGIGALAMYCGGNMTYADTLALSMSSRPAPQLKKGLIALFIKGGVWFGLFGGYVSLFLSVISGFYSAQKLLLFFLCLPVFALAGFRLFNQPFVPEKNRFPKIYFSYNRRETWGGLLGMLLEIYLFAAVFQDWSTLAMTFGMTLTGAFGWIVSQFLQIATLHPDKKGRKLFEPANRNGLIDAWKIMECTLGAFAGIGMAATFLLSKELFAAKFTLLDQNGAVSLLPDFVCKILMGVYGVLLLGDTLQYFILPATRKRYYKKLLKMNLLTPEGYKDALQKDKPAESESYKKYKKFCEHSEFAVYSTIPLTLCFFGVSGVAAAVSFSVILLVLAQEFAEKCFGEKRGAIAVKCCMFVPIFALFFIQAATYSPYNLHLTVILYTFFYEAAYFILKFLGPEPSKLTGNEKTVHGYFIICCLLLNIFALIIV